MHNCNAYTLHAYDTVSFGGGAPGRGDRAGAAQAPAGGRRVLRRRLPPGGLLFIVMLS